MKMKTSELQGSALDWAVALITFPEPDYEDDDRLVYVHGDDEFHFTPSTAWAQAGPVIEREKISLEHLYGAGDAGEDVWVATRMEGPSFSEEQGPTALVAAMRCYVAACLGDGVDVPEELQ